MNTKKTDENEPRYGCDNWDRPAEVTPDTMVECPSCGFTFRVGVRQGG